MIEKNKAYAWEADGKFYLSMLPATSKFRPKNTYNSKDDLAVEARKRGTTVVWDNNSISN